MNRLHFACEAVVTDIEGTTGSTAFVKDVLFPYADAQMEQYLQSHRHEAEICELLAEVARAAEVDPDNFDGLVAQLRRWIAQDEKFTPLKTLQGKIWACGYADGALLGHVYDDAADSLRKWHSTGLKIFVYSSGSVAAQRLLFSHSVAGDLTALFDGYFDTTTGPKREADSYSSIARAIALPAGRILFLSDSPAELDAAREAGFRTVQVVRANDETVAAPSHVWIRSFSELDLEPAAQIHSS
ncbi:MAG: acireductone synthase [Candidatus Eremiobacteraeota bacterium]|nr:acireductone synthase [Candidatus Eremiobacteraeota bacterium]